MPRPLLEIKYLRKEYGRQIVLDGVSFNVLEGQKIALIGRNGAGKSTLLNIVTEVSEPDAGEVMILPWTRIGSMLNTKSCHQARPRRIISKRARVSNLGR